ncbi:MAG TPA: phosphoribosylaminoimidazolesuccinocarboxamide synthase [Acidimicrobiales bacterium]|nr:phosphoribosylaminoimidazolesuccinocarboxamide synthase [Acidimicrobiales bacterium]
MYSGKVREIYAIAPDTFLFVASDRISAFDVVLDQPVPDKGRVLTAMTAFWFEQLAGVAPSHLVSVDPADFPPEALALPDVAGRSMLVRRAEMLEIECIVRGYLSGSAWAEYRREGTVHGTAVPAGMQEADRFPEPIFTPSTKAATGHDENITFEEAAKIVGDDVAEEARRISLAAYRAGADWAAERGIIVADTKFELGFIDGRLSLCDEVLTPDSSRFWPASEWTRGATPPSFDKQPVRDWLAASGWDRQSPPPALPAEVVAATRERYVTAYERLTGRRFADWYGV